MYPPQFDYHRATGVENALALLAEHASREPRVLAGGHSLLPAMRNGDASPGVLVDLGEVDSLRGVETADGETRIGATTTYADTIAALEPAVGATALVREATAAVGDRQVRNRGTVGGNLAAANPESDLPAAAIAADSTLVLRGARGERTVDADSFFRPDGDTALEAGELLTAVRFPHAPAAGGAYVRKSHPASGWAMIGVAALLETDAGGGIERARLAATGVADHPVRLSSVEETLEGASADERALAEAAARAGEDLAPDAARSDPHASGEFRRHLLESYAERTLAAAVGRADGGERT